MKPALDSLLHAFERRLIRRMMRRAHPEALMRKGRKWLLPAFRRAAARSPAYRALLAELEARLAALIRRFDEHSPGSRSDARPLT